MLKPWVEPQSIFEFVIAHLGVAQVNVWSSTKDSILNCSVITLIIKHCVSLGYINTFSETAISI